MPVKPRGRCTVHGCPLISVSRGRCAEHPHPAWVHREGAPRAGMRSAAERRLSAAVLREEPVCRRCRTAASTEVDHVLCIAAGGARGERENLQALCSRCHAVKTGEDAALLRALRAASYGPPPF